MPILASAYARVGLREPWHYRATRDTRTLYEAAGMGEGRRRAPDPDREHDAQYDCEYQVAQVCEAYAALREQSDHAALYLGRIGALSGERDAAPIRGRADETHDDPPIEGGYTGVRR